MDTLDMTLAATGIHRRFPELPQTSLADILGHRLASRTASRVGPGGYREAGGAMRATNIRVVTASAPTPSAAGSPNGKVISVSADALTIDAKGDTLHASTVTVRNPAAK
jgi:hypothetical protein